MFWCYGGISMFFLALVVLLVPETKGTSPQDMEKYWNAKAAGTKASKVLVGGDDRYPSTDSMEKAGEKAVEDSSPSKNAV